MARVFSAGSFMLAVTIVSARWVGRRLPAPASPGGLPGVGRVALGLMLLANGLLLSQGRVEGRWMPEAPWSKSDGDLGAALLLTDRPEEFFAAWKKGSPGAPEAGTAVAKRGSPLVGVVVFEGCAPDPNGRCVADVTYTVLKPGGGVYGKPQAGALWTGEPPPAGGRPRLAAGNIAVVMEPGDLPGLYTMRAEVYDRVSKKKLLLERTFIAFVEAPDAGP